MRHDHPSDDVRRDSGRPAALPRQQLSLTLYRKPVLGRLEIDEKPPRLLERGNLSLDLEKHRLTLVRV